MSGQPPTVSPNPPPQCLSAEQTLPVSPSWRIQVPLLEHKHKENLTLTERSLSTTEKNSGLLTNHGRIERETQPNSSELAKKIGMRALSGTKAPGLRGVQMVGKMLWIPSLSSKLLQNLKNVRKKIEQWDSVLFRDLTEDYSLGDSSLIWLRNCSAEVGEKLVYIYIWSYFYMWDLYMYIQKILYV